MIRVAAVDMYDLVSDRSALLDLSLKFGIHCFVGLTPAKVRMT